MQELNGKRSISVVIPVYNAEEYLKETIESVLNQTFNDFELIVVDDASTDRSKDIALSYSDPRIKYVLCKHDFIGTHRKGYKLSTGKYIAHLDHDDLMIPNRLQLQFDFMELHPDIDACGGYMYSFGNSTRLMSNPFSAHGDMVILMIKGMPSYNSTGFFKREFLVKNNIRHRRGYSYAADFKFWTDIAKVGRIANISEVVTLYRTSEKQASSIHKLKMQEASYIIQNEMINFLFSKISSPSEIATIASMELWGPSADEYFKFMYDFFSELKMKNEIKM